MIFLCLVYGELYVSEFALVIGWEGFFLCGKTLVGALWWR